MADSWQDDELDGDLFQPPDSSTQKSSRDWRGILAIVAIAVLLIAGYFGIDLGDAFNAGAGDPISLENVETNDDWYEIYFTDPTCAPLADRAGGVDETIAADIDRAQFTVDIAAFDLDSQPIIDALVSAEERGVFVRVVVDNAHTPDATINRLRRNGMSVAEDKRSPFMHNKFIVIDSEVLWTGSMNFTTSGVYCNNNNVVRLEAPQLAANYSTELSEMYDEGQFGPTSPENTEKRLTVNGVEVENYFASDSEVAPVIARLVARADEEILFMAFAFTNEDIGEAMIERAEDDVVVRGVFEANGTDTYSYYRDFRRAKLDTIHIREDGNPRIMHHKVIIIDRKITIFGSFNFSNNANDNNDENVLIIYDETFADYFVEEFDIVWNEAQVE